ncbi:HAD family hydrolase [Halomonas halocynthiae]|uniref:HAD family hydrolase n=1 Tax=Halomonas halocynthiae TaxID=176290 RepID=UPI0005588ED6|nr:HAD family hydrolase [Halomonas halocynthiae]
MTTPRLEALTFDLDDTLWDNADVMVRTEQGHFDWLSKNLATWLTQRGDAKPFRFTEQINLEHYVARRQAIAKRYPLHRGDFTWIREQALVSLLVDIGLPASSAWLWASAAMDRFHALRLDVTPYPEVEPLLTELANHYRLASITNGNLAFDRLPLRRYFTVAIAAGEIHAPKPDARPFLAALSRLNTSPSRALHVGDSWKEDILPAVRLGMRAAWIAPQDAPIIELPQGVTRLRHVSELPELLTAIESGNKTFGSTGQNHNTGQNH